MSWFSKTILDPIENVFKPGTPGHAAVQPQLQALATTGEQLTSTLATTAADAALATVPGGALFEGLANDVIPALILELFGRASPEQQQSVASQIVASNSGGNAPTPPAPPTATPTPPVEVGGVTGETATETFSFAEPTPPAPTPPTPAGLAPNPHYDNPPG